MSAGYHKRPTMWLLVENWEAESNLSSPDSRRHKAHTQLIYDLQSYKQLVTFETRPSVSTSLAGLMGRRKHAPSTGLLRSYWGAAGPDITVHCNGPDCGRRHSAATDTTIAGPWVTTVDDLAIINSTEAALPC